MELAVVWFIMALAVIFTVCGKLAKASQTTAGKTILDAVIRKLG